MNRKLWLLNVLLVVGIALLARELRRDWREAREREQKMLAKSVQPAPAPPVSAAPLPASAQAAGYAEVAQQTLFSKDRNSNVVVDPPPPPAPPPPFPRFYGVMNLGDGPEAILSELPGRQQRAYRTGDAIGEFKLTAIGTDELELAWKDKTFTKKFTELRERGDEKAPQETTHSAAAAPPPTQRAVTPAAPGPGSADLGGGVTNCNPGDTSPAGTVIDGKRKVVNATPFGQVCRWEPVR